MVYEDISSTISLFLFIILIYVYTVIHFVSIQFKMVFYDDIMIWCFMVIATKMA